MIVFTNGCFDILHPGHIELLEKARSLGTKLVVGSNSGLAGRSIKGEGRPLQDQEARKAVLLGLESVDEVVIFDEPTPERIIREIKPDILVKGGDWRTDEIIGADFVEKNGGRVVSIPFKDGFSTTSIVNKMHSTGDVTANPTASPITSALNEHLSVLQAVSQATDSIERCAKLLIETFAAGNKVLLCGNGGSAADRQHIAAEFVGRY